jgi:F-type H+-transporting ATPase subunit epsilon
MQFEIVTAEGVLYSDEVDSVVAPGVDGELGVLPNHASLLTVLKPGELRIMKENDETNIVVTGGFLEVLGNKVTVLADAAERSEEIDIARAEEAVTRAQERVANRASDIDLERALASIRRGEARIQVARRQRTRRPTRRDGETLQ